MFRNYLLIAFRNFMRNKTFSFINILGLSIGIAFCLLTFLFVQDEWTYDTFHEHANTIYRLYEDGKYEDGKQYLLASHRMPMAPILMSNIPEIKQAVRLMQQETWVAFRDQSFYEKLLFADASFFNIFSFPLKLGNPEIALKDKNSVVLSEDAARKYFGSENPMGKQISIRSFVFEHPMIKRTSEQGNRFHEFVVTGVARHIPENSTIRFDFLVSYERLTDLFGLDITSWSIYPSNNSVYIRLLEDVSPSDIEVKFPPLVEKHLRQPGQIGNIPRLRLQPLADVHFSTAIQGPEPVSNPIYSYILSGIALFVLLIACINFTNLSIGRFSTRAKEIGIRKAIGATRIQLMKQFWGEFFLLSFFALLIGIPIAEIILPIFNDLIQKNLSIGYIDNGFLICLFGLMLLVGFISGSYPAIVLSGFHPVNVLKGELKIEGKNNLRRVLVVVQFILSTFFIIISIFVYKQVDYMRTQNLGFNDEQIIVIPVQNLKMSKKARILNIFKNEMAQHNDILGVSGASHLFNSGSAGYARSHKDQLVVYHHYKVDHHYLDMMEVELVEGRKFSRDFGAEGVMVNEAWVKTFEWNSPTQRQIEGLTLTDLRYPTVSNPPVIGVVEDFYYESLHHEITPVIFSLTSTPDYIYIKIRPDRIPTALGLLKDKWHRLNPDLPFDFLFLDDHISSTISRGKKMGTNYWLFFLLCDLHCFFRCIRTNCSFHCTTYERDRYSEITGCIGPQYCYFTFKGIHPDCNRGEYYRLAHRLLRNRKVARELRASD